MNTTINFIAMFEGLSPEQAKDLAGRIRSAVGPEFEASHPNPDRIRRAVEDEYQKFQRRRREQAQGEQVETLSNVGFEHVYQPRLVDAE